jgi:hypothetical protein
LSPARLSEWWLARLDGLSEKQEEALTGLLEEGRAIS